MNKFKKLVLAVSLILTGINGYSQSSINFKKNNSTKIAEYNLNNIRITSSCNPINTHWTGPYTTPGEPLAITSCDTVWETVTGDPALIRFMSTYDYNTTITNVYWYTGDSLALPINQGHTYQTYFKSVCLNGDTSRLFGPYTFIASVCTPQITCNKPDSTLFTQSFSLDSLGTFNGVLNLPDNTLSTSIVEYGNTPDVNQYQVTSGFGDNSITLLGLDPGTDYFYKIYKHCQDEYYSPESGLGVFTTPVLRSVNQLRVQPNPVSTGNNITYSFIGARNTYGYLILSSSSGRTIKFQGISINEGVNNKTLSLGRSHLNAGVYNISISAENQSTHIMFIVQ